LFRDTKHNVVKSLFDAMDCTGQGGGLKFWRTAIDVSSAGCCLGGTAKRTMRRYTWNLGPGLIAAWESSGRWCCWSVNILEWYTYENENPAWMKIISLL
jgi:hypothetical protein